MLKVLRVFNYILLLTITVIFVYILVLTININKKIEERTEYIIETNSAYFAKNIISEIKQKVPENLYETLKNNPELRKYLENIMSVLVTPTFQYIYVLYRDKDGVYRYLLDGSKTDKGEFNDVLNVDTDKWDKVYKLKKPQIVKQKNIKSLYVTFLLPIIYDNQVKGVLAIDFSSELLYLISSVIKPIKKFLIIMIVIIFVLFLSIALQSLLNFYIKKERITDPLTNAYNRYYLRDFLEKHSYTKYAIAVLDIDHFKKINDNYGHDIGDKILQDIVKIIKNVISKNDVLVRLGGEEFLILIKKQQKDYSLCTEVFKKIHNEIHKNSFIYGNVKLLITVSIGVVLKTERYKNVSEVIKKADERLYIAKKEGRNKVVFISDEKTTVTKTLAIEDVKTALDEDRVFLEYQPIYNLISKEIYKYEALVRIKDGDKIYYPNSFLENIFGTNIYIEITKRVLSLAFETIKNKKVKVSINMNLSDIMDNVIFENLIEILKNNIGLANNLTIELLEYESLDLDILKTRIDRIKSLGTTIALDDFGSGFSNYETIQQLNIDILKIDGSLIKNIDDSPVSVALVESIVNFSEKLSIDTVGEFIHSEEVLEKCINIGINYGQGFYLGRPTIL